MEIALVGMAGRFPDADSVAGLWDALMRGHEAIHRIEDDELRAAGVPERHRADPAYVPYGTRVSGVEQLDAEFFGMTPAEAAVTDPEHRLFMECTWRALEDGGVRPGGRVGVFASTGFNDYLRANVLPAGAYTEPTLPFSVRIGNQLDFLASRVSHALDLRGPAVAVQSACSSSLIGVDMACTALMLGRCDVAVAGAAAVRLPQPSGYLYAEGGLASKDGHCRPFDTAASGFVGGNGAAVAVFKRLEDAVADRDRIYAVIRGIGINNDGADKISYAAPSTSGQMDAIAQAIAAAGLPSTAIGYVEAHGSGTALGDPIEIDALARAYAGAGGLAATCGLGCIKANVGHMAAAAGIAGLVKAALVLHHQLMPPQINYEQPNPLLELEQSGLVIHDRVHHPEAPLAAAAVSSLGVGGTNAHVILAAPPPVDGRGPAAEREYELPLSARDERGLVEVADRLNRHLGEHEVRIDDLAYTLAHGRASLGTTVRLQARDLEEAQAALERFLDDPRAGATPAAIADDLPGAVKIALPGYPLHPERHWIAAPQQDSPERPRDVTAAPVSQAREGDLVDRVAAIFARHIGVDHMGPDDDFDSFGGSSLQALEIVDSIAKELGATVTLSQFIHQRTPRRVAAEIRAWPGGNLLDPTLTLLRDGRPGEGIFFIYPVNGTVFCYHRIAAHTTFAGPVYAISYPFAEPDPPRTIATMAARCIEEMRSVAPTGPYRLAGYSMGGNLSVEIAHQLERAGEQVRDIVMIDALPVDAYPRDPVELDYVHGAAISLAYFLGMPVPDAKVASIDELLDLLRQPSWSPRTEEAMRRIAAALVRNAIELTTTPPPPAVDADLILLTATETDNPVYDAIGVESLPPDVWRKYTNGTLTSLPIPGNHYTMYTDPGNFTQLAAAFDRVYGARGETGPS
jgi:3-oxoacyl-(acyl-carrier-protein) synthase/thioesterase domain-containing protein/acyl carrier protein